MPIHTPSPLGRIAYATVTIFVALYCQFSFGEPGLRQATSDAVEYVLTSSGLPKLPSENSSKIKADAPPDEVLKATFERMNSALFPAHEHFVLKSGLFENILCDTERKYILVDPIIFESLALLTDNRELTSAVVIAHELAHYFFDVLVSQGKMRLQLQPEMNISQPERAHALVDVIACELLKRSGYSDADIRLGYRLQFRAMTRLFWMMTDSTSKDHFAREAAVTQWLKAN